VIPVNEISQSIRMGEIAVGRREGILRTLLGSCIGLALYDERRSVGGLAHIVLPEARGTPSLPGKFVDTAIPALLREMEALAGPRLRPAARIAGGANMFATTVTETVGRRNIEACERYLEAHGIPLLGRHCGGDKGRRMLLDTSTGTVTIQIVGAEPFEI
jgi:chemotaxis protein CheD